MPRLRESTIRGPLAALLAVLATVATARADDPAKPWAFKNHDRVVFVGDTFIERDQRCGYLETALTIANPDLDLTFRNLGWSGDTVRGLSRAGFDPPEAGFKNLVDQIKAAKPTVLVVGYGMADSFDGPAGLSRFVEGYNALLGAVAPIGARLILLSPLPHEALPPPLPDPAAHNRDLALYAEAVGKVAAERKAAFVDLFAAFKELRSSRPADAPFDTDDGIHLTVLGSWRLANLPVVRSAAENWNSELRNVKNTDQGLTFVADGPRLPAPKEPGATRTRFRRPDLPAGRYVLKYDGAPVATQDAEEWAEGVEIPFGPELEQVEKLRKTINDKNQLFFYRWRPQNITYLFGFRKHEQGRNAVEVPQFDPLVDAKEKEIARLRKPTPHTYELVRVNEASQ